MSEPVPHADDTTAYVLGTLSARERRRFEARLKNSAELRKMVRLLEIGSIGLAMSAPRREPPTRLWEGIHLAVTREREKQERMSRKIWLRSAVGIAACAIVGWFAYTFWSDQTSSANQQLVADASIATNSTSLVARPISQQPIVTNFASQPRRRTLRPGESATLRERVGDLENQVAHLTHTVAQHGTPPDFSPLTFLNIAPEGSDVTANGQMTAPSPELRRALLLGVARQLGWMPPPAPPAIFTSPPSSPPSPQSSPLPSTQSPEPNPPPASNDTGVEFVDLPPVEAPSPETTTASVQTPSAPPPTAVAATETTTSEENTSPNATSIPAYMSGTNLVFAIDSSVVPVGTETVSFYSGNAGGVISFRGSIALGNTPTVVTMPVFLQVRAWNSSAGTSANLVYQSPGRFTFGSVSEGSLTTFRIILPDPPSSTP